MSLPSFIRFPTPPPRLAWPFPPSSTKFTTNVSRHTAAARICSRRKRWSGIGLRVKGRLGEKGGNEMNKKMVWRYYCDYCKKSGCSAGHMKKHELHCTMNPNRQCGHCEAANETQSSISDLIIALGKGSLEEMDNLRNVAHNCPTCILAAIRQSGLPNYSDEACYKVVFCSENDNKSAYLCFDYKRELAEFWKKTNEENALS